MERRLTAGALLAGLSVNPGLASVSAASPTLEPLRSLEPWGLGEQREVPA